MRKRSDCAIFVRSRRNKLPSNYGRIKNLRNKLLNGGSIQRTKLPVQGPAFDALAGIYSRPIMADSRCIVNAALKAKFFALTLGRKPETSRSWRSRNFIRRPEAVHFTPPEKGKTKYWYFFRKRGCWSYSRHHPLSGDPPLREDKGKTPAPVSDLESVSSNTDVNQGEDDPEFKDHEYMYPKNPNDKFWDTDSEEYYSDDMRSTSHLRAMNSRLRKRLDTLKIEPVDPIPPRVMPPSECLLLVDYDPDIMGWPDSITEEQIAVVRSGLQWHSQFKDCWLNGRVSMPIYLLNKRILDHFQVEYVKSG